MPFPQVDVPFSGGIDQKTAKHLLPLTRFRVLENMYQEKSGALRMRNGFDNLAATTLEISFAAGPTLSDRQSVHGFGSELLMRSDHNLYTWIAGEELWRRTGLCRNVDVRGVELASNMINRGGTAARLDVAAPATSTGYVGYMHTLISQDGSEVGVQLNVREISTGAVMTYYTDASMRVPQMAGTQTGFVVIGKDSSTAATIRMMFISHEDDEITRTPITDAAGSSTTVSFGLSSGNTTNDYVYIAYEDTSGDLQVKAFSLGGSLISSYTYTAVGTITAAPQVYWNDTSGNLFVCFKEDSSLKYVSLDSSLSANHAVVTVAVLTSLEEFGVGPDANNTNDALVVYTDEGSSGRYVAAEEIDTSGTATDIGLTLYNATLASSPFSYGGENFFAVFYNGNSSNPITNQCSMCLVSCEAGDGDLGNKAAGRIVARALVNQTFFESGLDTVFTPAQLDANTFWVPGVRVDSTKLTQDEEAETTFVVLEFDMSAGVPSTFKANGCLYIAAGTLQVYDGRENVVVGFHEDPNFISLGQTASGGSLSNGTYGVALTYEKYDAKGNIHRSAPVFGSVTLSGGGSAQLVDVTDSRGAYVNEGFWYPLLRQYMTAAGGAIYYLNKETALDDPEEDTILGTDSDTSARILYTQSGEVAPVSPPTPVHAVIDGDMAALIPGDRRDSVWLSKPIVDTVAVEFSDALAYVTPQGENTALAFMDGRLIVFTDKTVRYGLGRPNAFGQGGPTEFPLVSSDVGAESWHSVQRVSGRSADGVIFKSPKGFYLLERSMRTRYIGDVIEDYNSYTVVDSVVLTDLNQVRFVLNDSTVLVYDYYHGSWGVYSYPAAADPISSTIWNGGVVYASANGVHQESASKWRDNTTSYTGTWLTGWLQPGIAGWSRLRRVGLLADAGSTVATIRLNVHTNKDEATISETPFNDAIANLGVSAVGPFTTRSRIANQKADSFAFGGTVTTSAASDKEPPTLYGLALEYKPKGGIKRNSLAQT